MTRLVGLAASHAVPFEGLTSCGDAAVVAQAEGVQLFAGIDGLGHGPDAEKSALAVAQVVRDAAAAPLSEVFARAHGALAGLRGAVMSAIRLHDGVATFAGVGNVEVFGPEGCARPVSMPGTLGSGRYRFREFPLSVSAGQRWVLASDGVHPKAMTAALKLFAQRPVAQAVVELVGLVGRSNDDVCAVLIELQESP